MQFLGKIEWNENGGIEREFKRVVFDFRNVKVLGSVRRLLEYFFYYY